jgi:hypothetical protein
MTVIFSIKPKNYDIPESIAVLPPFGPIEEDILEVPCV